MTADDQLYGWKDISKFLGVEVRTAQRYEKRCLPIRRNDAVHGRVYAVKAELQAWRDGVSAGVSERARPIAAVHAMLTLPGALPPGRYVVTICLTEHLETSR